MEILPFQSVIEPFRAVFLDSYGVLKNHRGLIEGVQQTVDFIRERGIALRILTNDASRSQYEQYAVFRKLGLQGIEQDEIITSGMLARQYLEHKVKSGRIAYLGTESAASYILDSGNTSVPAREVDLEKADEIDAFVFLDDEGFDWNRDINTTVNLLRRKTMPVIVANSDKLYPVSRNDVALATGSVAQLVESILNRSFIHFGKPDSQMFMYAFDHLNREGQFGKDDILMVGDTLHTDILGGNKFGLKTTLVLSGNTSRRNASLMISATGIIPDYICESIVS